MSLDVYLIDENGEYNYHSNITHNLGKMAEAAGIYYALWRPEEIAITKAGELIDILLDGYCRLASDKKYYEIFNSPNGWGLYEHFLPFVSNYINACVMHPESKVEVSR